jgi:uncharacterized membrane protein YdjX (TVP38/TMEM64 family)
MQNKMTSRNAVSFLWLLIVLTLFVGSIWLIRNGELQSLVRSLGLWAPVVLVLLKITTLVVAPLGGTPIYLVSGALYGNWGGMAIVLVGDLLGSSACFWISRRYGERVVKLLASDKLFEQVRQTIHVLDNSKSLAKARLGAMSMPELLAYAAGFSRIGFWRFTFINMLFYIPVDIIYVFFGTQLRLLTLKYYFIVPLVFGLTALVGFGLLYKDYQKIEEGN